MVELNQVINTPEKKMIAIELLKEVRENLCPECQLILKEMITDIALY